MCFSHYIFSDCSFFAYLKLSRCPTRGHHKGKCDTNHKFPVLSELQCRYILPLIQRVTHVVTFSPHEANDDNECWASSEPKPRHYRSNSHHIHIFSFRFVRTSSTVCFFHFSCRHYELRSSYFYKYIWTHFMCFHWLHGRTVFHDHEICLSCGYNSFRACRAICGRTMQQYVIAADGLSEPERVAER